MNGSGKPQSGIIKECGLKWGPIVFKTSQNQSGPVKLVLLHSTFIIFNFKNIPTITTPQHLITASCLELTQKIQFITYK